MYVAFLNRLAGRDQAVRTWAKNARQAFANYCAFSGHIEDMRWEQVDVEQIQRDIDEGAFFLVRDPRPIWHRKWLWKTKDQARAYIEQQIDLHNRTLARMDQQEQHFDSVHRLLLSPGD
jgi:hypothetical protein